MVYALMVARVEARANVERQVTAAIAAAGGKVELFDVDVARDRFDTWLTSDSAPVAAGDASRAEWRRVMLGEGA